jgi:hypothetical protein
MRNSLLNSNVWWRFSLCVVWDSDGSCADEVSRVLALGWGSFSKGVKTCICPRSNLLDYISKKILDIILDTSYDKFLQFLNKFDYSYNSDGSCCIVNCFNKNEFKSIDDPRCTLVQFHVGYEWWLIKSCSIESPRIFSDTERKIEISCFVSALNKFYLNKSL